MDCVAVDKFEFATSISFSKMEIGFIKTTNLNCKFKTTEIPLDGRLGLDNSVYAKKKKGEISVHPLRLIIELYLSKRICLVTRHVT